MRLTPMGLGARGRIIPCSVGRGGLTLNKREGDGATPIGEHRIVGLLYRPDRVARPARWAQPILTGDLWCDASGDVEYNQYVRAPFSPSHEALRRADPLYDIVLITDWNWPDAEAGKGSAIFLHQWRRPGFPTAGCIAMARRDLAWLASVIEPGEVLDVPALPRWPAKRAAARHGKD
ncbi:L,D-transpeptidase family protein [Paracoccus aestuariivivens]|uniref:L,D-transpeptidase family protein n=1 Tax=Paracoccus aestuariivivens TaxID=1820333 RepID=A0A6L6J6K4_9RHOB|nr:L,D-transpeptidase family protein [Paracoccus aestuariivivens]